MSDATASSPVQTPPALACKGLERYLGEGETRVHVLRGVDLSLEAGRTYAVVGPSGCGKSTLLYLLGLLDRPDGGEIYLRGEPMAQAPDAARTAARNASLGFVFQFHFLLPEFSAEENIMLPMRKLGKLSKHEMQARARHLLAEVGLEDKAIRRANALSGGEQQRVAIARALANEPALILADEPTGNLDTRNSQMVFDLLRKVAAGGKQAILVVTHNPELAQRCDEILPMADGLFVERD